MEPEHEGNIGSIARSMKNFGLNELWLVNPKVQVGKTARALASHALDVLENVVIYESLEEASRNLSYVVGTTSISAKRSSNLIRTTITPERFAKIFPKINGNVGLILGRESSGLSNEELSYCDLIVTIPTSSDYKALNVASASVILFYELWKARLSRSYGQFEEANREYRDRLVMFFSLICQESKVAPYKKKLILKAFKNVICRACLSKREATLMLGVFRVFLRRTLS